MKKFIAILLCLAMVLTTSLAVDFKDVENSKNKEAIETLYNFGIVEGYNNFYFYPKATLSRAEACAIIVRALVSEKEIYKNHYDVFDDVSYSSWAREYIDTAYRNGYMHGYGKTFGPEDEVTYAQFATILTNVLGYYDLTLLDKWPVINLNVANHLNLFKNTYCVDTNLPINREDAVQMIFNALDCSIVKVKGAKAYETDKKFIDLIDSNYTYSIEGTVHYLENKDKVTTFWLYDNENWTEISINDLKTVIHNNDTVNITYNYKNEIVEIKVLTCVDYPYSIEGVVTKHARNEDKLTFISINGIPFTMAEEFESVNINGIAFADGVYIRAIVNENNEICYFEFYSIKE